MIDPSIRWMNGRYDNMTDLECKELVDQDLFDIDRSVGILLNAWSAGWGSGCELRHAHINRKLVVTVANGDLSPWLRVHSDYITNSVADACWYLKNRLGLEGTTLT